MKVFALGGYGKVGLAAIQLLAQSDMVTEIAIAGRNLDRAQKATTEIGEKAVAVRADGTDEQTLTSLLAGYNIIMNSASKDSVIPAIRAAMHNCAHYCDAASFGDFVEQVLQLTPEAEVAGISAIVANGIHPSISNLMGVYVARQRDEVEQLQLGDASIYDFQAGRELTPRQWLKEPRLSLAVLHDVRPSLAWVLQIVQETGIRMLLDYRDGQWVEVDPIRDGLEVPLPEGGTIFSRPFASSAPLFEALPRDLAAESPVEMLFSSLPPQLHDLLRELAVRVLEGSVDSDTALDSFYDAVDGDPSRWLTLPGDFVAPVKLWARAVGRKDGRAARCTCWLTDPMWDLGGYYLTSIALAVAVRKILSGEIQERGVMHAETAFEPQSFFDEVIAVLPDPPPDGRFIGESFEWLA
jgi:hypothetical protein